MASARVTGPAGILVGRTVADLADDASACRALLRAGSKSFHAASKLLPTRLSDDVAAVYGFCRISDDAIDESGTPTKALEALHARLDAVYANTPFDHPVDRQLCGVVSKHELPKGPFLGLLEGFLWDVEARSYPTLEELEAYCARVASSVGVLMTLMMGRRTPWILARACDLGLAMQLTNIARDVGEDLGRGRIYLPLEWLAQEGLSPEKLLESPVTSAALSRVVRRLLNVADVYYERAAEGIPHLPFDCRTAIGAALGIYQDIGREIRLNQYDSVSKRAYTSLPRKLVLLGTAARRTGQRLLQISYPQPRPWPVPEATAFLCVPESTQGRVDAET